MEDFIGQKLEVAEKYLKDHNILYTVKENNHKVDGDVTLVTNQTYEKNTVVLTVGKFIFTIGDGEIDKWNKCR